MATTHSYWEVLLRLPGTRHSSTAARWLNLAFHARGISAHATSNATPFARIRATTAEDLQKVVELVTRNTNLRDEINLDAQYKRGNS
jgi:hypothetical protein